MPTRFGFVWLFRPPTCFGLEIWDLTDPVRPLETLTVDALEGPDALRPLWANERIVDLAWKLAENTGDELLWKASECLGVILLGRLSDRGRVDLGNSQPPFYFRATSADFPDAPRTAFDVLQPHPMALQYALANVRARVGEAFRIPAELLAGERRPLVEIFREFLGRHHAIRTFDDGPEPGVEPTENREAPESMDHAVDLATSLHDDHVYQHDMNHARDNAAALRRMADQRDRNRPRDTGRARGNFVVHAGNGQPMGDASRQWRPLMVDDPHAETDESPEARRRALEWYETRIGVDLAGANGDYSAVVECQTLDGGRLSIVRITRRRLDQADS